MKKRTTFSAIQSRAEALKVIKDSGIKFMVAAVIHAVAAYFYWPSLIIHAVILFVLGALLWALKSRVIALLLLPMTFVGLAVAFLIRVDASTAGASHIFLFLLLVWAAIKAIEATFKLHSRFKDEVEERPVQYSSMVYLDDAPTPTPAAEAKDDSVVDIILMIVIGLLLIGLAGFIFFYLM